MTAFATAAQYQARYGTVDSDLAEMLAECLDDATAAICAALDARGVDYSSPSEEFADRLMRVCRSVANRLMPSGSTVPVGVTQASMTAVGFTQSLSFGTTYGTPKLLPSELKLLGISSGIGWAQLGGRDDGDDA